MVLQRDVTVGAARGVAMLQLLWWTTCPAHSSAAPSAAAAAPEDAMLQGSVPGLCCMLLYRTQRELMTE